MNTARFDRGLQSASGKLSRFGASIARAGAAAAAAGVAGATAIFVQGSAAIDRMAKLGRSVAETAGTMAGFQIAADRGGVSIEQLAKGTRDVTSLFDEFLNEGTKRSTRVLERLGLTADQVTSAMAEGPAASLRLFAEALGDVESEGEKVAIITDVMGSRSAELLNVLGQGSGALDDAAAAAKRFGLVVDQDAAERVELLNDRMGELGLAFRGFGIQLTAQAAGPLLRLVDLAQEYIDALGGVKGIAEGVAAAIDGIADAIETLQSFGGSIGRGLADLIGPDSDIEARANAITARARGDSNTSISGSFSNQDLLRENQKQTDILDRISRQREVAALG